MEKRSPEPQPLKPRNYRTRGWPSSLTSADARRLKPSLSWRSWKLATTVAGGFVLSLTALQANSLKASGPQPIAAGKYIEIVSDCLQSSEAAELAAAFDAAVPAWCELLEAELHQLDSWRVTAHVMQDREAMERAGVLPAALPPFTNGVQRGRQIWIFCQPSQYYTRHLLLHEGVHALYAQLYGATGPGWYQEGMAELLATHRWNGGGIELPIVPDDRETFEYWGRFRVLDQWRRQARAPSIDAILNYQHSATDSPAPYAWTWSLSSLSGGYPEFRRTLIGLRKKVARPADDFNRAFLSSLEDEPWRLRWRILVDEFDYGYDLQRNALRPAHVDGSGREFAIAADAGWHDSGLQVQAGQTVSITATGRFQIGSEPKPWICEPQGVTVRYHRGRPLGMLLATVAGDGVQGGVVRPLRIQGIGTGSSFTAAEAGRLLLRINDNPAELADNSGTAIARVEIAAQ